MKHLTDYIAEACNGNDCDNCSKTISFDFTGIEGADEFLKSLSEKGQESGFIATVSGNNVTLALTAETIDKAKATIDEIKSFISDAGKSAKRSSNEQYAQKLQALETSMKDVDSFVDSCNDASDEADADDDKKDEE